MCMALPSASWMWAQPVPPQLQVRHRHITAQQNALSAWCLAHALISLSVIHPFQPEERRLECKAVLMQHQQQKTRKPTKDMSTLHTPESLLYRYVMHANVLVMKECTASITEEQEEWFMCLG